MFRKELTDILLNRPMSISEIATLLDEPPKQIQDDITHLLKSLRHMKLRANIIPARCHKCGFIFHKDKITKPGKCPSCHATWIEEPRIELLSR